VPVRILTETTPLAGVEAAPPTILAVKSIEVLELGGDPKLHWKEIIFQAKLSLLL